MIRLNILLIALFITNALYAGNPTLGKTHFIVGVSSEDLERHLQPKKSEEILLTQEKGATGRIKIKDGRITHAFFSPHDEIKHILIDLIEHEATRIAIAIFAFTDGDIAQALINAHKRGVKVEVVVDGSAMKDRFSKVPLLQEAGVPVFVYTSTSAGLISDIMHNKFALFVNNYQSRPLIWTGSFNFTKSAHVRNRENVTVTDDARLVKKYQKEFERLKKIITEPKMESVNKSGVKTAARSSKRKHGQKRVRRNNVRVA